MLPGKCIRIYLSESDQIDGKPAMESILALCKQAGLRGVSVVRATEGIGSHGVHSTSFLSLSSDLPLLVEAIDTEDRISHALEIMRPHLGAHLVAVWHVSLMKGEWENDDDA
ncbi:MAG TPA: DUF190 domain-containing protein [Mariprofundaceae bacterium]|nr:DUF190 domain-containing protein [Mariprofundaceae bacterium]